MVVVVLTLSRVYEEIDMVTTPAGKPVAMVHCNNCTNELNAWAALFQELMSAMGCEARQGPILDAMFRAALSGEKDGGGTVLYNFLSGEPVAGLTAGRPLLARTPEARLTVANVSRVQVYSALAALKQGLDILSRERVALDRLLGHGGYFKAPEAGQRMLAAAAGAPVSVMETAGEGGPWGMALLAAYSAGKAEGQSLEDYLDSRVFAGQPVTTIQPDPEDAAGFNAFMERYVRAMPAERAAVEHLQ